MWACGLLCDLLGDLRLGGAGVHVALRTIVQEGLGLS
jgi:hypothetical protein